MLSWARHVPSKNHHLPKHWSLIYVQGATFALDSTSLTKDPFDSHKLKTGKTQPKHDMDFECEFKRVSSKFCTRD